MMLFDLHKAFDSIELNALEYFASRTVDCPAVNNIPL